MIFLADFVSASVPPRSSHGNSVAHWLQPDILRNSAFLILGRLPRKSLVDRVCVACTRLCVDLRDSSERQAGVRFLRRLPAAVLTGTQCRSGRIGNIYFCRIGNISCCADLLLPDSSIFRWKTSCGSSLPSKNPSIFEEPPSSKNPPHLRRTPSSSKKPPSSIFGAEDRRTPHLRFFGAEERRTLPSSIFDLRPRRSKNSPPSWIFGPEEWSEH